MMQPIWRRIIGALAVCGCGRFAMAQIVKAGSDAVPVSIRIAVASDAGVVSRTSAKIKVLVTNRSDRILVHSFPIERGSVHLDATSASGEALRETDAGCKRHMSTACGPQVKLGGPVSFTAMVVMPGQSVSFEEDVAAEYRLDGVTSVALRVTGADFVLVDAPPAIYQASSTARRAYLMDYKRYSYSELPMVHSNALLLQIRQ